MFLKRLWDGVVPGWVFVCAQWCAGVCSGKEEEMEEGRGGSCIIGVSRSLGWIVRSFIKKAQVWCAASIPTTHGSSPSPPRRPRLHPPPPPPETLSQTKRWRAKSSSSSQPQIKQKKHLFEIALMSRRRRCLLGNQSPLFPCPLQTARLLLLIDYTVRAPHPRVSDHEHVVAWLHFS